MTLLDRLFPPFLGGRQAVGLLGLRVVAGSAMAIHGSSKIKNPFGWAGDSYPAIAQLIAAVCEFFGGIAIAAGVITPVAAFGVLATMAVAALSHIQKGQPFVGKGGSYELAALHGAIAAMLALVGPGKLSVDHALFGKRLSK
jgi:putative oxidoreductase